MTRQPMRPLFHPRSAGEEADEPGFLPEPAAPARLRRPGAKLSEPELEDILDLHREWVESEGQSGRRADLSRANLEGVELIGVNLRGADLNMTNLKDADLLLANLQGASLIEANLEEANLVGANFKGASLEGADLRSAMGLLPRQLAGANLHAALLPDVVSRFDALETFRGASRTAYRQLALLWLANALAWLIIAATKDANLLADSSALPFSSRINLIPAVEFYLFVPLLLFCFYIYFHFHLHRLWQCLGELPAVLPDGEPLEARGPHLLMALARSHCPWMNSNHSAMSAIESGIAALLVYWIVPVTLVLFWARFLTLQDIRGTLLHVLLVLGATAAAGFLPSLSGGDLVALFLPKRAGQEGALRAWKTFGAGTITLAVGFALFFLSIGTIEGVPHDTSRAPQIPAGDIRRWAADVFWVVGYDPYADLTESVISKPPDGWNGEEDGIVRVTGPRLNGMSFRYAQAYRVFLANAHLFRADFEGAFLSDADLRGSNLSQANLAGAVLDRAELARASLERADMRGANFAMADLRGANLSFASLENAILADATLPGANLYGARLSRAVLARANLEKADLREAQMDGASLENADLREAYVWSTRLPRAILRNAQLDNAILIDAELEAADLRGARFPEAVLTGADLRGANLAGADLRGANGLSADQVCSAADRRGAQIDPPLETQVESLCGAP